MLNISFRLKDASADVRVLPGQVMMFLMLSRLPQLQYAISSGKKVEILRNRIIFTIEEWCVLLILADNHVYLKNLRLNNFCFSTAQQERFYRHFIHPSVC